MHMPRHADLPCLATPSEWPVEDRRVHPRHDTPSFVRALDRATLTVIGEVDDISPGGFRLQLTTPDAAGDRPYRALRLDICIDGVARESIDLVARLRWVRHDPELGVTLAGFEMGHLSPKASAQLQAFIGELAA